MIKKILKLLFSITPSLGLRVRLLRWAGYKIGNEVFVPSSLLISDLKSRRGNVSLGDRVSIGPRVIIVTDSSPNHSRVAKVFPLISENVNIEKDAWIGSSVTILPGVTIGEGAVVAAGAVVNSSVDPFTVVGGVPAKKIRDINPDEL